MEDIANAEFIVRACNSHDALVTASRALADVAERNTDDTDEWEAAISAVRAAIALATGKAES
jgi:hypothetical protein